MIHGDTRDIAKRHVNKLPHIYVQTSRSNEIIIRDVLKQLYEFEVSQLKAPKTKQKSRPVSFEVILSKIII